jgi:Tol biopolymer transport system component
MDPKSKDLYKDTEEDREVSNEEQEEIKDDANEMHDVNEPTAEEAEREEDKKDDGSKQETEEIEEDEQADKEPAKEDLPVKSAEEMLVEEFESLTTRGSKRRKMIKALVVGGIAIFAIVFLAIATLVLKLDSLIFPSSVFGTITDFSSRPLDNVEVCMQGRCVLTDNDGYYNLSDLKYGIYDLSAQKDKYHNFLEQIDVQRGKNEVNRQLKPFGFGEIVGILSVPDLKLEGLSLKVDDEDVEVNTDGSFAIKEKMIGKYSLSFTSPYYKDFTSDVELKEGLKDLGDVVLLESRDLTFLIKDWITSQPLKDVKIKINDLEQTSNEEGKVEFRDLDLADNYAYETSKQGYNSQSETLTTPSAPELFALQEVEMVRTGRVIYTSSRLGNSNVYAADYNGGNEKMLSDNRGYNYAPKLLNDNQTVLFLSTRDGITDAYGEPVGLVYRVNIDGSGLSKYSKTSYEDYGSVGVYNYQAGKRAFIKYDYDGGIWQQLYFGNLDGTETKVIYDSTKFDGYMKEFILSPDGKSVVMTLIDTAEGSPTEYLVRINTENGYRTDLKQLMPFTSTYLADISNDSKNVLIISSGMGDGVSNVYRVGILDGNVSKVTNNTINQDSAVFSPDPSFTYFSDSRDGRSELYKIGSQGGNEIKLSLSGKFNEIIQMSGSLVFFLEEGKLKVVDSNVPGQIKEVTSNISTYNMGGF